MRGRAVRPGGFAGSAGKRLPVLRNGCPMPYSSREILTKMATGSSASAASPFLLRWTAASLTAGVGSRILQRVCGRQHVLRDREEQSPARAPDACLRSRSRSCPHRASTASGGGVCRKPKCRGSAGHCDVREWIVHQRDQCYRPAFAFAAFFSSSVLQPQAL